MHATTADHVELRDDLRRLVTSRLLDPVGILLGSDTALEPVRHQLMADAEMWAAQLLGTDERLAVQTAARLIAALYPQDAPFDPPQQWWRTPLGRVVAHRVGHPAATRVSLAVAGAMLGITRQGVHDLVNRNKLQRHPDGGITTASVRDRLHHRARSSSSEGETHDRHDRTFGLGVHRGP